MPFNSNVFINCPFDADYRPLLKALTFTIVYLGLEPKLSQTFSSSAIRINQIKEHIRNSKYSIHDLSRSKPLKKNELPRFNMPNELGLDIGCGEYGGRKFINKKALILETEKYHYQKVLSDIAGQDIENHNDDQQTLIQKVRNWISANRTGSAVPGPSEIWIAYNLFNDELTANLVPRYSSKDLDEMPIGDYIKFTKDWVKKFKA
ncbi:MAG: hypothetical protein ABI685_14835 [Ferruginibacter sp.]